MFILTAWSVPKSSERKINWNQKDRNLLNPIEYYQYMYFTYLLKTKKTHIHRRFKSSLIYSHRNQTGNYFPSMENITRREDRRQKSDD